ncbi:hexose carrier protein [Aureobasidium pullulans]|nr:hexose carrier protein [Aureobasidium pullulans]
MSTNHIDHELVEAYPVSDKENREHIEVVDLNPLDVGTLSYGKNGIAGILSSGYIFGVAFLASMASAGGFSFGYDQGVISLILTMQQLHDKFPETALGHPSQGFYVGFMTGMLELGAFLGCLAYPYVADRWSRKWGLSFAVAWFCIGAILQTAAQDYGMLVAGRTIGGVGVGTLALGAPLYISEISPPNLRGSLLVLETFSIVIGAIIAYWLTYGTAEVSSEWALRLPILLQIVPALMVGIGIHLFPYSPRWLCMRGRDEEALLALSTLKRLSDQDIRVQNEWKAIIAEVRLVDEVTRRKWGETKGLKLELLGWMELFSPKYLRRTAVAAAIPFFQQFSGINAFVYYALTLFKALGQNDHSSLILSGMINVCQLVGACIIITYLDKIGRRKLAIFGGIAMGIPHAILAGLVAKYNSTWESHPGPAWFGVALVYFYVLMYSVSYGPLGWTLPAEPNSNRAKGVGMAVSVNWIANTIIGIAVPPMIQSIGFGTYIFFACFCFLASMFSFFMVPETSNLTLEEIDGLFNDNSAAEEAEIQRVITRELTRGSTMIAAQVV